MWLELTRLCVSFGLKQTTTLGVVREGLLRYDDDQITLAAATASSHTHEQHFSRL